MEALPIINPASQPAAAATGAKQGNKGTYAFVLV